MIYSAQSPESAHTIAALLREMTGDNRWQSGRTLSESTPAVKIEVTPNDPHAKAFVTACRAIGAPRTQNGTDSFTVSGCKQDTISESMSIQLPIQWDGEEPKDRVYFRLVATTTETNTQQRQESDITCYCDQRGNFFTQNRTAFVVAYSDALRQQLKPPMAMVPTIGQTPA